MNYSWDVLLESLKLPGRLILFAIITWLITFIVPQINNETIRSVIFLLLTLLDKFLHESANAEPAKTRNEGLLGVRGLTGF
jgi:hypothetical protein